MENNYYTPVLYKATKGGGYNQIVFTKYVVDDNGHVFSLNYNHTYKKQELVGHVDKDGYVRLCMRDDSGKIHNPSRARIVASTFFGKPEFDNAQVNHKSEVKTDDKPENLEWCNCKYNNNYGTKNTRAKEKLKKIPHTWRVKPVRVWKFMGDYTSIAEAAKELGLEENVANISASIGQTSNQTCVKGFLFVPIT